MDPEAAKSHVREPSVFRYTTKDAILYTLGSEWDGGCDISIGIN